MRNDLDEKFDLARMADDGGPALDEEDTELSVILIDCKELDTLIDNLITEPRYL